MTTIGGPQPTAPLVLIADDQPSNRAILRRYVESAGYRAAEVENGVLALDAIDAEPPDALLLDIFMPVLDGFGVLRALRNRPQNEYIPVIVVTAAAEMVVRQQAYHEGADDFLLKPVDSATLRARLRAAIRLKQMMHQLDAERKRFEFVAGLSRDLVRLDSLEKMLDYVVTTSTETVGGDHCNLFLVHHDDQVQVLTTDPHVRHQIKNVKRAIREGAAGHVARTRESLIIDDIEQSSLWLKIESSKIKVGSAIMVPVQDADGLLGVLSVYHHDTNAFDIDDQRLVELIAQQIVGPIRQGLLMEQQHALAERLALQTRQLTLINSLAHTLNANLDLTQLYQTIDAQMEQLIGDVGIGWYTYHNDTFNLTYTSGSAEIANLGDSSTLDLIHNAVHHADSVYVLLESAPPNPTTESLIKQGYKDCLILPLVHQADVFGILILALKGRTMTDEERNLLEMARPHLAVALNNAQQVANREAHHREQNELRHLRNMEELAGSMAHHFNNLFAVILGNTQLAELDAVNEDQQQLLGTIVEQVRDGAAMINRLHWLKSNQRTSPPFALDLNETMPSILDHLEKTQNIPPIRLELEPNLHALIYERELLLLCSELISNALDSGSDPSKIVIKGHHTDNAVHLQFIDAGNGIEPERMDEIWKPFCSTKGHQRLGLGLSICSALLWRIGGSITITNHSAEGVTVDVTLPMEQPQQTTA